MKVLVTGGAGYIGSTICSALIDHGHKPVILDNFVTGRREFTEGRTVYEGDISDEALLERIFSDHPELTTAIHCAALIVVPESVSRPLDYYENNVAKLLAFVRNFGDAGGNRLIFSSSASIYRPESDFSVDENSHIEGGSPYARTKVVAEAMLADVAATGTIHVASLRYFNPVGADPKMRSGLQHPRPTHVVAKMVEAFEAGDVFTITGTDWPTRDGTGIRDYVHVWDLAVAHVLTVQAFATGALDAQNPTVINLGTGSGTTVRELADAFERATGHALPVREAAARPGDVAGCYTRSRRAEKLLGWRTAHSIEDGIADALTWARLRPQILGQ